MKRYFKRLPHHYANDNIYFIATNEGSIGIDETGGFKEYIANIPFFLRAITKGEYIEITIDEAYALYPHELLDYVDDAWTLDED